jgi:hypothetical protein
MDTLAKRCTGALRIRTSEEGSGNTLKFVNVPDSMSGALLEELCGLDGTYLHPLKGAVYQTKNNDDGVTFNITIYQNDCKNYIAQAFAKWSMGRMFMEYADSDTKFKIETAKAVPA